MNCPVGEVNVKMGADDDISQHSTGTVKTEPLFEHNSTILKREKLEALEVEERDLFPLFPTDDVEEYDAYNNIAVEEEPPRQDAPLAVPDFQQPKPHGGVEHQESGLSLLNKNAESKGPALRSRLRPCAVVMTAAGYSGDRRTTTSTTKKTTTRKTSARQSITKRTQMRRATGESDSSMHLRLRTRKSNSSTEKLLKNSLKTLEKKQYVCVKCKYAFWRKCELNRHERNQYVCGKCKNTFCGERALNRHEIIIHLKLKTYKCSTCNRVFIRQHHLTAHITAAACNY
ncbi:zinc finger protein 33B [Hyalella azteca]|uniref:Zinc finger protein 33B n=1 Tax=Hyalella azteca TaxID=294128 RepID=A0A8B7PMB1_HYAAZ|nr:zinc finger protein 33B [Hyalella azteca]